MKKNKQRQSTVTKFRTRWKNNLKRILVALNLRNYMNISNTKIWSIERGKFELKNVASTVDMKIFSHCNLADACAEPGGTMLTQCWLKICRPHWLESICDIHVRSFVRSPVRVASDPRKIREGFMGHILPQNCTYPVHMFQEWPFWLDPWSCGPWRPKKVVRIFSNCHPIVLMEDFACVWLHRENFAATHWLDFICWLLHPKNCPNWIFCLQCETVFYFFNMWGDHGLHSRMDIAKTIPRFIRDMVSDQSHHQTLPNPQSIETFSAVII